MKRSKIEARQRFALEVALRDHEMAQRRQQRQEAQAAKRRGAYPDVEPPVVVIRKSKSEVELEYQRWRDKHMPSI